MAKKQLTDRQRKVLEYIREYIIRRGSSPTVREIGQQMGISSTNGVRLHLTALIKKGYLKKQEFIARGLELAESVMSDVRSVPVVGSVPAGNPIDAVENIEGHLALDASLLPRGNTFSLRVVGDSMRNAGIHDGDYVIVEKQPVARANDIVVAIIGEEATVKRYMPDGNKIRLQPENDAFQPIIVDEGSADFRIAGRVVGLIRRF